MDGTLGGDRDEFNNLNIKQNASESDDEREQRIFQFSPLSSKKNRDEEESEQERSERENRP